MKRTDKHYSAPNAGQSLAGNKVTSRADRPGCHRYESFPDAEATLLCCFDTWLQTEQSKKRLRRALIDAGFAPGAVNYLIRTSRLLYPVSRRRYRIRPFAAASAPV